jgi:chromosome partitioning protein
MGIGSMQLTHSEGWQMALVLTVAGHKGGIGKSTTSLAMAGAVLAQKRRCLLVDLDPQATITQLLLPHVAVSDDLGPRDTAEALEHGIPISQVVREVPALKGLHVLPARPDMKLDDPHLRLPVEQADVDVVICDTAPDTRSPATMAALLSSHGVITPTTAEIVSLCTLPITMASLSRAMAMNPALVHIGYLITRYDQRELAQKECEQLLRRTYGRQVLETMTPACAEFGQANSCRVPVEQFKAKGKAAKAVRAAWLEIIDRISDHHSKRRAG